MKEKNFGKYKIKRDLHHSRKGTVIYKGQSSDNAQNVVIKVLPSNIPNYKNRRRRFIAEARIAASLNHPHIVKVINSGEDEDGYFIVFEFIDGITLNRLIAKKREFTLKEALDVIVPIAEALDYAHQNGIIHCSIKPANIMVEESGRVKVIDFGEAYLENSRPLLLPGIIAGSQYYSSPEQAMGHRVDRRSDIYSLGAVFYELLTGQPPFIANSPMATLYLQQTQDLSVQVLKARILPAHIEIAIVKSLNNIPANRYQSIQEFLLALTS